MFDAVTGAGAPLFLPQEVIRRKRDGQTLDAGDLAAFMAGLVSGAVTGEQAAAFAMATFFRGMQPRECAALTQAMASSGTRLDWRANRLPGPILDKHSTGGIGDNVSLMLAPILAACGAFVPMISGRGLGHTGGTLDKLDAVPGYRTIVSIDKLREVVAGVGCAIVGANADLAPADARLYAIRDVTATVDSIPLITASILSKKLAAGLDALVMDVKAGSGATLPDLAEARILAETLVAVAEGAGLRTEALITDMDQALASAAGNAVEVRHAISYLTHSPREARVEAVVTALGTTLLMMGGIASNEADAEARMETVLANGAAAERFAAMVAALGGPADLIERPDKHLPAAPVRRDVMAVEQGFVVGVDARAIGIAVVRLGGGRTRPGDTIDPRVGFAGLAAIGAPVGPHGIPLGQVNARDSAEADAAGSALRAAYRIGAEPPAERPPVLERLSNGRMP